MILTIMEMALIGGFFFWYWTYDTKATDGSNAREVERKNKEIEHRDGSQSDPVVLNQKEVEAIKRGITLPAKTDEDLSRYESELDMLLLEARDRALALQTISPEKMQEYGNASWRTSGKVLQDMLYFKYPREPVRPPIPDYSE